MEYGQTQDGMPWGLEGIQLSKNVMAYWKESASGTLGQIINFFFGTEESANKIFAQSKKEPYYDFYLSRDKFPTDKLGNNVDKTLYTRDYKGIEFNREIATTLKASTDPKAKIDEIILTEDPKSAFAYCYHKNKRNSSGVVENQNWFLPAIDEIEDIALGAYEEFDEVFQNREYWSCQPAYDYNTIKLKPNSDGNDLSPYVWFEGEYYSDNLQRARSTSVHATSANAYTTIESGLPSGVKSGHLEATSYNGGSKDGQVEINYNPININYNADIYTTGDYCGNSSRTERCRVRAVYRSGIDTSKPAKQQ